MKLNAAGSGLVYSTYLGGAGIEYANAIALDATGSACVVGYTESANFPVVSPLQTAYQGLGDIFITKLSPSGSTRVFASTFGGTASDTANAVAIAPYPGTIMNLAGSTDSTNFPVANSFGAVYGGATDAVVVSIGPNTTATVPAARWPLVATVLGAAGLVAITRRRGRAAPPRP